MKNSRSTVERIRPILEAMERSIDSARRRRLNETDTPVQHRPLTLDGDANANVNGDGSGSGSGDSEMPRRKARPKRATPTLHHPGHPEYRAKAI